MYNISKNYKILKAKKKNWCGQSNMGIVDRSRGAAT